MKNILYGGHDFTTTDDVAAALLDFVVSLARTQPPEVVTIPVIIDGRATEAALVLTSVTPVAVVDVELHDMQLDGADYAVAVLRHKTQRLDSVGIIH